MKSVINKNVNNNKDKDFSADAILMQSLEQGGMMVCIKDINKLVLRQNNGCKSLCGNREGESCFDGCMEIYDSDNERQWNSWGNRTYSNCNLNEGYFDVTLLCSDDHLVTILQPLEQKQAIAIEHYQDIGLSKREFQVISLVVNGLSNNDICQQLFISNATLRTHLNRVYSKVNDAGLSVEHLPKGRRAAGGN